MNRPVSISEELLRTLLQNASDALRLLEQLGARWSPAAAALRHLDVVVDTLDELCESTEPRRKRQATQPLPVHRRPSIPLRNR